LIDLQCVDKGSLWQADAALEEFLHGKKYGVNFKTLTHISHKRRKKGARFVRREQFVFK